MQFPLKRAVVRASPSKSMGVGLPGALGPNAAPVVLVLDLLGACYPFLFSYFTFWNGSAYSMTVPL